MNSLSDESPSLPAPLVSVVIPAYNNEKFIKKAIASALGQTLRNIEVIIVDDGSTDRTREVVSGIDDERLTLLLNSKNLGVSSSRNRGFQAARGEWVALLDSDDWYAPERLEKLLESAAPGNVDIIADDLNLVRYKQNTAWNTLIGQHRGRLKAPLVLDATSFVKTDQYGRSGLKLGWIKPIFRREFLIKNDLEYDTYIAGTEDFWFYLRCLIAGAHFTVVPDAYYFLYSRPGSLVSSSQVKRLSHNLRASDEIKSLPSVQKNHELVSALEANKSRYQHYYDYFKVVEALKTKDWGVAFKEILQRPFFFRVKFNRILERFKSH